MTQDISTIELTADKLLTIVNGISDGVLAIDTHFNVTFINSAAENILEIDSENAVGKKCCEIMSTERCDKRCPLKATMRTGKPIINQSVCMTKNKKRLPLSISTSALRDDNGQIIGGVETFRDLSLVETLRKELEQSYTFEDMIGRSKPMKDLFNLVKIVAQSDSTVFIEGESGSGKELVAKALHSLSSRKNMPFVTVNCSALPDTLLESELFGYKAGAFTDAKKDKKGRFDAASGGTIFLDEIGELSQLIQVKLLRVIQEKEYEPLGGIQPEKANVRIITATNQNLSQKVKEGKFRKDFYYRINVIRIYVPPLCERREDIPLLIDHIIGKFNQLYSKNIAGISPYAMSQLMNYDFPGNVRELENIIEHSFVISPGGIIRPEHLPEQFQENQSIPAVEIASDLKEMEGLFLIAALKRNNWNRQKTAKELNINPSTLYRKLKKLNMKPPNNKS